MQILSSCKISNLHSCLLKIVASYDPIDTNPWIYLYNIEQYEDNEAIREANLYRSTRRLFEIEQYNYKTLSYPKTSYNKYAKAIFKRQNEIEKRFELTIKLLCDDYNIEGQKLFNKMDEVNLRYDILYMKYYIPMTIHCLKDNIRFYPLFYIQCNMNYNDYLEEQYEQREQQEYRDRNEQRENDYNNFFEEIENYFEQ